MPNKVTSADKKMQEMAGVSRVYLHGCVGECKKKVWGPDDTEDVCEYCGANRFDARGKPREFVVHFPLKEQFASLLACKQFQAAVRWESQTTQQQNPDYMCGTCERNNNNDNIVIACLCHANVCPCKLLQMFTIARGGGK